MKVLLTLGLLIIAHSTFAFETEVATLAGLPNENMSFVHQILKEKINIVQGSNLNDYTTAAYYFAARNGVQSSTAVQALNNDGSTDLQTFFYALEQASKKAAIVTVAAGPVIEDICLRMAAHPAVVYIVPISSNSTYQEPTTSCLSKNILFVAGLNQTLNDLEVNQSFGPLVRLAIPYMNLKAPVDANRSITINSKFLGMSFVAGKMAQIIRNKPNILGQDLVDRFFAQNTIYLPSLEGKVGNPRALVEVNY